MFSVVVRRTNRRPISMVKGLSRFDAEGPTDDARQRGIDIRM